MESKRRDPEDKLVRREYIAGRLIIAWEDRSTGERYGGEFSMDEAPGILRQEGLDPDSFNEVIDK